MADKMTAIQRINYLHLLTNSCLVFCGCCSPTSYDSCVVEKVLCVVVVSPSTKTMVRCCSCPSLSQALVSPSFFSLTQFPHHNKGRKGKIPFLTIGQQGDIWGQKERERDDSRDQGQDKSGDPLLSCHRGRRGRGDSPCEKHAALTKGTQRRRRFRSESDPIPS